MALFRRQRKLRMTTYIPYTQRNADHEVNIHSHARHVEPAKVIVDSLNWTIGTKESGGTFTAKVSMPGNGKSVVKLDRELSKLLDAKSKLQVVEGMFYSSAPGRLFGKITFQVA